MTEEIKPGDVIQLKSGGPLMTASSVGEAHMTGDMTVWCEWFDDKKQAQKGTFSLIAVKKVEPLESAPTPARREKRIIKH